MAGLPEHEPTDKNRLDVEELAGYGIAQERIAKIIGIDAKTLRKHYRHELDLGIAKAHMEIAKTLKERAKTDTTMGIFYAKTQMGWSEKVVHKIEMPETVFQLMKKGDDRETDD